MTSEWSALLTAHHPSPSQSRTNFFYHILNISVGCVKDVNFTQDVCQRIKKLKIQTDVNLPLKNLGKVGSQSSGDK